ncbi:hypothetical protein V496_10162 [Pseudogymnoascus sp. VKM F-4515 (FW-2607)]|nr:hypothetical protein V496_10162 [Pseudogymnoascus sp. VKM F-4515 (FW-2607)]
MGGCGCATSGSCGCGADCTCHGGVILRVNKCQYIQSNNQKINAMNSSVSISRPIRRFLTVASKHRV